MSPLWAGLIAAAYAFCCAGLYLKGEYPKALMCLCWGVGNVAFIWDMLRDR